MATKINTRQCIKKQSVLVTLTLIVLVAATTLMIWHMTQVRQDAQRFSRADQVKDGIMSQMIAGLTSVISVEESNVCYNSEQGPWDNGKLWCQVASAAYMSSDELSEGELRSRFEHVLQQNGTSTARGGSGDMIFYGDRDLLCDLTVYSDSLASSPGYYFPSETAAKQTFMINCAARAKAKHFTYVGS